jgi:hypothetical protein
MADEEHGPTIEIAAVDNTATAFDAVTAGLQAIEAAVGRVETAVKASTTSTTTHFNEQAEAARGAASRIQAGFTGVLGTIKEESEHLTQTLVDTFRSPEQGIEVLTTAISTNLIGAFNDMGGALDHVTTAIGVGVAAVTAITAGIIEMGKKGTEVNDVREGFDRMAGTAENADEVLKAMRKGVAGTVDDLKLMKDANHLLAVGMEANAETFGTMTQGARVLSRDGFGSVEEVMNRVNRAMETGQTRRLALMGLTVDQTAAEAAYARAHDIVGRALSRTEKLEADRGAILAALNHHIKEAGDLQMTFGERMSATVIAVQNFGDELAGAIAKSPAVTAALDAIQQAWEETFGGSSETMLETIVGWVDSFADKVREYGPPIITTMGNIRDTIKSLIDTVVKSYNAIPDWVKAIGLEAGKMGAATVVAYGGLTLVAGQVVSLGSALVGAGTTMVKFITFLNGVTAAEGTVTAAMEGMVLASGPLIIAVAAIAAGYKIWSTYAENAAQETERAAMAARNAAKDIDNTARVNEALGTSFKSLAADDVIQGVFEQYGKKFQTMGEALNYAKAQAGLFHSTIKPTAEEVRAMALATDVAGHNVTTMGEAEKVLTDKAFALTGQHKNLGDAMTVVAAKLKAGEEAHDKFNQQVEKAKAALRGESQSILVTKAALDELIIAGKFDEETKQKMIDKIEGLVRAHQGLTAVQQKFFDDNKDMSKGYQAIQKETEKLWDEYYQTIDKDQEQSLKQQLDAIDIWYKNQYAALAEAATKNPELWSDASEKMQAIDALLFEKRTKALHDDGKVTEKILNDSVKLWEQYDQAVDKDTHATLDAQIAATNSWYNAQYDAIAKEAKTHEDAWAKLEPLAALFYAKLDKARKDDLAKTTKDLETTGNLWQEYYALIDKDAGDTTASQIANVNRWFQNELDKLNADTSLIHDHYDVWLDHYNALYALAQGKMAEVYHQHDLTYQGIVKLQKNLAEGWQKTFSDTLASTHSFKDAFLAVFKSLANDVLGIFSGMFTNAMKSFVQPLMTNLSKSLGGVAASISGGSGAAVGGGVTSTVLGAGIPGALGSLQTGGFLGGITGGAGATGGLAGGTTGLFGLTGVASSLATMGIGAGVMAGIYGLTKLFGASEESKQVNQPREQYVQSFGGLGALNTQVQQATGSLALVNQLLNAKTAADYQKAVDGINKALGDFKTKADAASTLLTTVNQKMATQLQITPELQKALDKAYNAKNIDDYNTALKGINDVIDTQNAKQQDLDQTMQKYGLDWTEAGDAAKTAHLDTIASGLIHDFNTMHDGQVDINHEMEAMKGQLNDFVKEARKSGVEVPAAMEPILQHAIDAGTLYDENGKQIKNMSDLGLTFGQTMETQLGGVTDAITHLADVLQKGLTGAFNQAATTAHSMGDTAANALSKVTDEANTARDAIDRVTFGSSPGGIVDVIAHLEHAADTAEGFASAFVGHMGTARSSVDLLTGAVVPMTHAAAAGGPAVQITVEGSIWSERELTTVVGNQLADLWKRAGGKMPAAR